MGKLKCGCVTADAKNTPAVRSGHELAGYTKSFCDYHKGKTMAKKTDKPAEAKALMDQPDWSKPAKAVRCVQCNTSWSIIDTPGATTRCPNGCPGPYADGDPHVQSVNSKPHAHTINSSPWPFDADGEAKPHTHKVRRILPRYVYHVSGHAKLHAPHRPNAGADSQQVPQAVPFEVVIRHPSPITRDEDMEALRRDVRNHVQDELKKADSPYLVGDTMIRGLSFLHVIMVDSDDPNGEPARAL